MCKIWKFLIIYTGVVVSAFLGFLGLMLLFPGAVLLIAAVLVATKLEDFYDK